MTAEELSLLRRCLDDPQSLPKLIFADWLLDQGREWEAHGYRWAARYGRHPLVTRSPLSADCCVAWGRLFKKAPWPGDRQPHMLPWCVADALKRNTFDCEAVRVHEGFRLAMEALGRALDLMLKTAS
jgi:hypothetical protein